MKTEKHCQRHGPMSHPYCVECLKDDLAKEKADDRLARTTCSALVRRCNVCNVINAVDLDATPERWAEMQRKDHTVWHVDEETAIKLWNDEGGKCDHEKLIAELRAKISPQNARAMASGATEPPEK